MLSILQIYNTNHSKNFIAKKNIEQANSRKSNTNSTMNLDTFTMSKNAPKSESERELNRLKQVAEDSVDAEKGAVAHMKAMRIAKKIARGERVSPREMKFIREVDEDAYTKAKIASYRRNSLELKLKYKSKTESEKRLNSEEVHALSDSDKQQAECTAEGVREVRKRKKMKYKSHYKVGRMNEKI